MDEKTATTSVPNEYTDADGNKAYYGYYGRLGHQQNMLQDSVRTAAYQRAITTPDVVRGARVMDVGAGSGVLSYFSLMAGASKVFAVEASAMAARISTLVAESVSRRINPFLYTDVGEPKVAVVRRQVEDCTLENTTGGKKVDVIVSEPIGVLLVHERMCESFLVARDTFLREGGTLIPSAGSIYLAPFTDTVLWNETSSKARFWEGTDFHGVDLTPLSGVAHRETFAEPVVGFFGPNILLGGPGEGYRIDFETVGIEEIRDFTIGIDWTIDYTGLMHGVAGWFDLVLGEVVLGTGPADPATHWQQIRFVFAEPLAVNAGEKVVGQFHMKVNKERSYNISCSIEIAGRSGGRAGGRAQNNGKRTALWELHNHTYWTDNSNSYDTSRNPEDFNKYPPVEF